jgi:hypothetical protein
MGKFKKFLPFIKYFLPKFPIKYAIKDYNNDCHSFILPSGG